MKKYQNKPVTSPDQYRREGAEAMQDATHYGIGIMQGGKRIAPEDFYTQPDTGEPQMTDQKQIPEVDQANWQERAEKAEAQLARLTEAAEGLKKTTWMSNPNATLIINSDDWNAFCAALAAIEDSHG